MELGFDKEMDAILRKGPDGFGASAPATEHLDADTIAAFAENALPQRSRALYTAHLADCDRCRTQLVFAASMYVDEPVTAASVVATVEAATIPWYRSIFRAPSLAMAMGALVITFGGMLGYLMLRSSQSDTNATISQVSDQEEQRGGPSVGDDAASFNSNRSAANTPANIAAQSPEVSANAVANSAFTGGVPTMGATPGQSAERKERDSSGEMAKAEVSEDRLVAARPAEAAPPPPAVTLDGVDATEAQRRVVTADDKAKDDREASLSRKRADARRDLPAAASKSGPSRSGPLQTQSNQVGNITGDMSVTRNAGGKTFTNRDGAWYDSAYRGQATQNYRRSSVEYKKLDSGLRKTADTIGGTVVIVWKSTAYRIN